MNLPVTVLAAVFVLIAVRQIGNVRLQIWQIMLGGAVAVLAGGAISPGDALASVDADVMVFLFGMFVVGHALEESGYLAHVSYKYFKRARSLDGLLLLVLFGMGAGSAVLMNDTLAIIGVPVVLLLARRHEMPPKVLLLALCFAITTGSIASPIGNPQNLLVALAGGMKNPFVLFLQWLLIPTLLSLGLAFIVLKLFYRNEFHDAMLKHSQEPIRDHELAVLARIGLQTILVLIGIKIGLVMVGADADLRLTYIAAGGAMPVLVGSRRRLEILRRIDWSTLVFFAAMFVLMESVWRSGVFQEVLADLRIDLLATGPLLGVSVVLSQLISNVPLVALLLPVLDHLGASHEILLALAAGSTLAGNMLILGAASNVIVLQQAERRGKHSISFVEFARVGVPLTVLQTAVYWLWFAAV